MTVRGIDFFVKERNWQNGCTAAHPGKIRLHKQ